MRSDVSRCAGAAGVLILCAVATLLLGRTVEAQNLADPRLVALLQRIFPGATFSEKTGDPPHFNVFLKAPSGVARPAGIAFWTTELEPLERGYDGPIKMLVGLTSEGIVAGVVVVEHREPYGSFSIDPPEFAAQFRGKSVRDPFRVGSDVDAVSRASITIASATRAIRNSARRAATALLTPPAR